MYHSEQSEAPSIVRVEVEANIRFKGKDGVFEVYDRATKEKKELKEITIVPVNDSRFTVKAAQNDEGSFLFSAMYKSAKQNITILRSTGGKVSVEKQGTWAEIKDANLKYTRVMYCILRDGKDLKRAEFDLQGIGLVQWGKIRPAENKTLTLAVSAEKTFKTPKGQFYEMTLVKTEDPKPSEDTAGKLMAADVITSFASFDENYAYREQQRGESVEAERAEPSEEEEPTIDLKDEEKVLVGDVPF